MASFVDRVRDASRPTNTIVEAQEQAQERRDALHRANPSSPPGGAPGQQGEGKKAPAYQSEPEHIAKAYYVEEKAGERSYYDDYKRSAVAMRATDTTISSKREDLNTVRAMVDIAAARGWQSIDVAGSKEFKREAWIEAAARGIEAKGYRPNDPDRQEADRRRNERGYENEVRGPAPSNPATPAAPITPNNPNPSSADTDRQQATARGTAPGKAPDAAPGTSDGDKPTMQDNRRAVREAQKELSPDGRTMFSAMSEKIDRQMNKLNSESKAEMKAFVAVELVKKERAEGPIVLSPDQKRAAVAPEPTRPEAVRAAPEPTRRQEPETPRRTLGR
jgi:hypothetical protein